MSDLYHKGGAVAQAKFRDATDRAAMLNVQSIPARARCRSCGKMRTAASGKYSKSGKFTCAMCHSPRRVS